MGKLKWTRFPELIKTSLPDGTHIGKEWTWGVRVEGGKAVEGFLLLGGNLGDLSYGCKEIEFLSLNEENAKKLVKIAESTLKFKKEVNMASIKFRDNYFVEIRDNDNRVVILHIDDVMKIVRDVFRLVQDIGELKNKLNSIFKDE